LSKTLLYKLFRVGAIPKKIRPALEAEGILICDEGIGGWLIMKNFRAPGKRFKYRMQGFSGFLVITNKRIVSNAYGKRLINVPLDDPKISEIHSKLINPHKLELSFDASKFQADRNGLTTVRFKTPLAREFHEQIELLTQGSL
jgi:hypothetical protein